MKLPKRDPKTGRFIAGGASGNTSARVSTDWKWHDKAFTSHLERVISGRLKTVGAFLKTRIAKKINISSNRGATPSKPGEPPHKLHGHLQRTLWWNPPQPRNFVDIGTSVDYGVALELGLGKFKNRERPFIRVTLNENLSRIKTMLTRPIP